MDITCATFAVCNTSLIRQVYDKACQVFKDIYIVTSHHERFFGIEGPIVPDILPIPSSISGITSPLLFAGTQNSFEPLHAVYNRSCLSIMLTRTGLQCLKITNLFPFFSVREVRENQAFVDRGVSAFTNVTVEEDLCLVQRLGNR
jgi:molybdopterin-guanine dinucleotide biosynthesis protein A